MMFFRTRRSTHALPWPMLVAMLFCAAPLAALHGQAPQPLDYVYRFMKDSVERLFPLPQDYDTATVGTFDAKTGQFAWRAPLSAMLPPALLMARVKLRRWARGAGARAHRGVADPAVDEGSAEAGDAGIPRESELPINARDVGILFKIANAGPGGVQATVNGTTYSAAAGQSTLTVDVKQAVEVEFELHGLPDPAAPTVRPPRMLRQRFAINHHPYPIAGAFIVQALPISILYAPPQHGPDSLNWASKGSGIMVSSSITTMFSTTRARSSSEPSATRFDDLMTYKTDIKAIADAFGTFVTVMGGIDGAANLGGGSALSTMKTASGGLSSLSAFLDKPLGSASARQTDSTAIATGTALTISDTARSHRRWQTHSKATPGSGDIIAFLPNAKFLYAAYYPCAACEVEMYVTLLGTGPVDVISPPRLTADLAQINAGGVSSTGFNKATIQFLLSLDPYVGRGDMLDLATVDSTRFVAEDYLPVSFGIYDADTAFTHDVKKDDWKAAVSATTVAQQLRPGFLCFLDIGVTNDRCDDQNTTLSMTATSSTLRESAIGKTVTWAVHLETADTLLHYHVQSYWDRVLGTFAFSRDTSPDATAGVLRDNAGHPVAAGQLVTMSLGGRTLKTRTDAHGHYSFPARPYIKPGQTWVVTPSRGKSVQVIIGRQPLRQDLKRDP